MFVDELSFIVEGGTGGDGAATFYPGYNTGPSGGNGGRGGNIFIAGDPNMSDLYRYSGKKKFTAHPGGKGANFDKDGAKGEDVILPVPIGTTVTDTERATTIEITTIEPVLVARGGRGGKGNTHFVSSTNRSPTEAEKGRSGQKKMLRLVVRLIADVGLIGLPNAGKSSLLNELTAASVKTAAYPFTTLEPHLGACGRRILADIPGLIEGASKGKGLGIRFLKHIEKVHTLFHCVAADSIDPLKDYETIREELGSYNKSLLEKEEVILLTKSDLVSEEKMQELISLFQKIRDTVLPLSIYNPDQVEKLRQRIS